MEFAIKLLHNERENDGMVTEAKCRKVASRAISW